jgi:AmiR/NasT family two-component response regulator
MSSLSSDAAAMPSEPLLVLVRDLLFSSRIAVAARHAGVEIKLLRDAGQLAPEAGERLIVDLNQPEALEAAAEWRRGGDGRTVIGFVAHVDADTIRRAREAGIDRVLPRSRFVAELESLLRGTT